VGARAKYTTPTRAAWCIHEVDVSSRHTAQRQLRGLSTLVEVVEMVGLAVRGSGWSVDGSGWSLEGSGWSLEGSGWS
jgi:hypothetical protein